MKKKNIDFISLCCIIKNEAQYLDEWIMFHKMLGVNKFYIYDNESIDKTRAILDKYIKSSLVEYELIRSSKNRRHPQVYVYNKCIKNHRFDTKWLAFIDVDEFIIPIKSKNLVSFLNKYKKINGLEINWMIYGDNNKKKKENKFVIERFTKHAQNDFNMNLHIKSIVDPRKIFKMLNAHIGIYKNLKNGITPDKTRETMFFLKRSKPHLDLIRINHYRNKTWVEHKEKMDRFKFEGKNINDDHTIEQFNINNRNEVKNEKFMLKLVKRFKKYYIENIKKYK